MKISIVSTLALACLTSNVMASNPNDDKGKEEWTPPKQSAAQPSSKRSTISDANSLFGDWVDVGGDAQGQDPDLAEAIRLSMFGGVSEPMETDDPELAEAIRQSLQPEGDETRDENFALALQMSSMISHMPHKALQEFNDLDTYSSLHLNELSYLVQEVEHCLNNLEAGHHEDAQIYRLKLDLALSVMQDSSFVKAARQGLRPLDQSDLNYGARLHYSDKIRSIDLRVAGLCNDFTLKAKTRKRSSETLLLESDLKGLPTYELVPHGPAPKREDVILFTTDCVLRDLVRKPRDILQKPTIYTLKEISAASQVDLSNEVIFLQEIVSHIERTVPLMIHQGMISTDYMGALNSDSIECVKQVMFPAPADLAIFEQSMRDVQQRYLTARNSTDESKLGDIKGFQDCQALIRKINSRYPGMFQAISMINPLQDLFAGRG